MFCKFCIYYVTHLSNTLSVTIYNVKRSGYTIFSSDGFVASLFRRKSQAIVIARLWSLLSCNNLNVAHYSKSIKVINTKLGVLGILAYQDKVQLHDMGHNPENYMFVVEFRTFVIGMEACVQKLYVYQ